MLPPPKIPWQVTGNHWIALPCIHPADGSLYAVSVVDRHLRGAVEMAGAEGFVDGVGEPLLQLGLEIDGTPIDLTEARMAWQRALEWLPTFNTVVSTQAGDVIVRGTIFAPFGRGTEMPGFIYALSFENRCTRDISVRFIPHGTMGWRQRRVRTPRPFGDAHTATASGDTVTLGGTSAQAPALAIAVNDGTAQWAQREDGAVTWSIAQAISIGMGTRAETAIYVVVAPERDGAAAMLDEMRTRGFQALADGTHRALAPLQQSTNVAAADRLITRHILFAYFYGIARALDDAQLYVVRSRAPWNEHGVTVRDWEALMWLLPAVRLIDPDLSRELLFRMCEIHGYAPGRGINYLDGTAFRLGFSLDAVAAYPIAVDRYITQTGDDRIVEEPALADTLYTAHDEITKHRHAEAALYATDVAASGRSAPLPYLVHTNAVVADALDVLRQTLDEKTAETVEEGSLVRSAIQRHFQLEQNGNRSFLATGTDMNGTITLQDDPSGSAYWLPMYDLFPRDDAVYRRTLQRITPPVNPLLVATLCAALVGPDAEAALDRLRRAPMDNGIAAEQIDEQGNATGNGGDASLAGLIGYTVWYAVHALGVRV